MANWRKITGSALASGVFLALVFTAASFLFHGSFSAAEQKIRQKSRDLAALEMLMEKKHDYETAWRRYEALFSQGKHGAEVRNQWMKELIAFAEGEQIVFEKIEPQGIRQIEDGEEIELYLLFEGNIRQLIRLLYYFVEKDPAVRIRDLSLRREDSENKFTYKLAAGKVVL